MAGLNVLPGSSNGKYGRAELATYANSVLTPVPCTACSGNACGAGQTCCNGACKVSIRVQVLGGGSKCMLRVQVPQTNMLTSSHAHVANRGRHGQTGRVALSKGARQQGNPRPLHPCLQALLSDEQNCGAW